MVIHQQHHCLWFADIMNRLYSYVEGEYYTYMQCADMFPSNYFEVLTQCLWEYPHAMNCYSNVIGIHQEARKEVGVDMI